MSSVSAPAAAPALVPAGRRATFVELLSSTDHKRIGVLTLATALGFFFAAGALALVMRTELARSGMQIVDRETYNQLFTIHGTTMILLFAPPAVMAVGTYLVPLQVGAADIVWPRLSLLGSWLILLGGLTVWSGFLTENGPADFAWFAFLPLSDAASSPWDGADLWVLGVALSQLGVLLMGIPIMATIVRRRAPGMTLLRMPLFTWSMVATLLMVLVAWPVVIATMVLLFVDRNAADVFTAGGGSITYQNLFWFFGHPLVYVVFFPLVGAVGEVIATFSRKRFFGFEVTVLAQLLFAALSTSVWSHHMFTTQSVDNKFFSLTTTAIAVPAGVEYFAFLATMWRGRIRLATPMLFALGFVILFLIGGLSGIFVASPPLDYHVHDSYVVVAHFHYTLFGGTVFGLFAAIYYWYPKVTGRRLGEALGRWQCGLMFVGALLTFVPMFLLGFDGMARQIADYPGWRDWETLNTIATIGAWTLAAAFVLFVVNVLRSRRLGEPAGPDPWDGQTLEWVASSPPARHNFGHLPPIASYAPLHDLREQGRDPLTTVGGAPA
ncbi:MAG TPA: cbb3-type cytochrome c oxidase subunit I [Capillimicrobium sp.]|nr:cbb3-type cytochrome c oxidase subunit I [Capillimicrobium sp.]